MIDLTVLGIAFGIMFFCVNVAGVIWHRTKTFEDEYAAKNDKVLNILKKELHKKVESIVDLKQKASVESDFGLFEEKIWEVAIFTSEVDDWYHHIERGKNILTKTASNLVKFGICVVLLTIITPVMIESDMSSDFSLFLALVFIGTIIYAFTRINTIPSDMKEYHQITKLIESQSIRVSKGLLPKIEPEEDLEDE